MYTHHSNLSRASSSPWFCLGKWDLKGPRTFLSLFAFCPFRFWVLGLFTIQKSLIICSQFLPSLLHHMPTWQHELEWKHCLAVMRPGMSNLHPWHTVFSKMASAPPPIPHSLQYCVVWCSHFFHWAVGPVFPLFESRGPVTLEVLCVILKARPCKVKLLSPGSFGIPSLGTQPPCREEAQAKWRGHLQIWGS